MPACAEKRQPPLPPEALLLSANVDVVVVHKEELLRHFLEFHLSRGGYRVRAAEDTIDATQLVLEETPDAMVLDLEMEGVNCFEFLAQVRGDSSIPYFPVIYLASDMKAAAFAHDLGAACVHKPVQPAKLLATLALSTMIQPAQPAGPRTSGSVSGSP